MLLLNFVRTIITLLGLLIVDAFRAAYALEGLPLVVAVVIVLFVVFIASDAAEAAIVDYFNPEEEEPARRV